MKITLPELSLVLLIGPSGSGKSTFGRKHFLPTEVVSSDFCRGLVSDDENDQSATGDAFDTLYAIARKRLTRGRLTVIDATNVQPESRKGLIALAREFHVLPVGIVFDLSERVCLERNALRPDRQFGPHVVRNQAQQLRRSMRGLEREGLRHVFRLSSLEDVENATVERQPLWNNRKSEHGPFDIIGDVHGCFDELIELTTKLGYTIEEQGEAFAVTAPQGRILGFVGDLVDRGPGVVRVLRLVSQMVRDGQAFCVPGNHDIKLMRALRGKDVKRTHGLAETMEQLESEPSEFRAAAAGFLDDLVSHYVFDDGKLVVAHAGLKESMQGRGSGAVREFAELTSQGREGMVVKPLDFIATGRRGVTQPAIKCRGPEYLRIIYGPEYLLPENLERLRSRNVGSKRSLASREFALGIEALERFVRKEPLRLTHECVFGVLALESEPVDPRL